MIIGVDIGGANLKVTDDSGTYIHYCPLWKESPISDILKQHKQDAENAAVVMSGELADCFLDKMEGISFIVKQVQKIFPDAMFYGTDGNFHKKPVPVLAAANWLASADYLKEIYPDAVLLDMGSTTTDIIPLGLFEKMKGQTDLSRLQQGYLVYTGLLRTNVAAVVRTVLFNGVKTPVSSEYFATTGDAHLVLKKISESDYKGETADGAGKTELECMRRLARVICSDLPEIKEEGAVKIAKDVVLQQINQIKTAVAAVSDNCGTNRIILAGIAAPVLKTEFSEFDLIKIPSEISDALPAYAVREVMKRNL